MTPQAAAAIRRMQAEEQRRNRNRGAFDALADLLRKPEFPVAMDPALIGRECCDEDTCDCTTPST